MILYVINLLIVVVTCVHAFGYDSGSSSSCGSSSKYRSARSWEPPCDLGKQGWCTVAGTSYPWHAVRRFIRENHGLMKRMYGEERHIAVLRAELITNDIEQANRRYSKPENEIYKTNNPRLLNQDDVILNTKFVFSEEPNLRTNDLYNTQPHFRQTTTTEINPTIENNTISNTLTNNGTRNENNSTTTSSTTVDDDSETENVTETEPTTEEWTEQAVTDGTGETTGTIKHTLPPVKSGQLFQDSDHEDKVTPNYKLRGVNACPVKEEVVAPFWANNTRGEILALLNLYPFEQYVHWEKCTYEYRQMYCRDGCRCEQQYRLHRLLAYDPNNECRGIFSDWFKFPSCCICKCYDMPPEFRVTSRSPRTREPPGWYRRKYEKLN